jgi:glycosyltransferase involved in cell wall biosynthesis
MVPKVTIGISFRDPGDYFRLALQSVFAQTFEDFELVLIDDGSLDGSLELARSLRDSRVRLFSDGETKRSHIRGNELAALARGEYFFIMDADDVMHPERLAVQYSALKRESGATVVGSQAYAINGQNEIIGIKRAPLAPKKGFTARHSFINPTVAAPTSWFRENRYSEHYAYHRCQDSELWCRTTAKSRFINLPVALLYYREVGVFTMEKYLATNIGVLTMLWERFREPGTLYCLRVCREILKIACVGGFYYCGGIDAYSKMKYGALPTGERDLASEVLGEIASRPLPV